MAKRYIIGSTIPAEGLWEIRKLNHDTVKHYMSTRWHDGTPVWVSTVDSATAAAIATALGGDVDIQVGQVHNIYDATNCIFFSEGQFYLMEKVGSSKFDLLETARKQFIEQQAWAATRKQQIKPREFTMGFDD